MSDNEEVQAEGLVSEFEPDYFVCGHLHQLPQVSERGWLWTAGKTTIINAGQRLDAPYPNYIVWDTESKNAVWRSMDKVEERPLPT